MKYKFSHLFPFTGICSCAVVTAALTLCTVLPVLAQTSTPALSAADYTEILALYAKYPMMLDTHDAEGYANLFTEDGAFGDRTVGRKALMEFAAGRGGAMSTVRHVHMTPVITPTAEGASGTVLNFFIDVGANPPAFTRASQYTDTLVKTPQGWRFKKRVNGPIPGTQSQGDGAGRGGPPSGNQPPTAN